MWYDHYDEDDLDNHHPTCKGGCNQLADECMCNWPWPIPDSPVLSVVHVDESVDIKVVKNGVDTETVPNIDYDEDAGWVSDHLM